MAVEAVAFAGLIAPFRDDGHHRVILSVRDSYGKLLIAACHIFGLQGLDHPDDGAHQYGRGQRFRGEAIAGIDGIATAIQLAFDGHESVRETTAKIMRVERDHYFGRRWNRHKKQEQR
jgi:hypothetical protein